MGPNKRFDYIVAGFVYDAAVLVAVSRYLLLQHEHPLVTGYDDAIDAQIQGELSALKEIHAARAADVQQLVWWAKVDRLVRLRPRDPLPGPTGRPPRPPRPAHLDSGADRRREDRRRR